MKQIDLVYDQSIQRLKRPTENDPLRQLAETTEETAVRQNYDGHNARIARVVSILLMLFSGAFFIAYLTNGVLVRALGAGLLLATAIFLYLVCSNRNRHVVRLTQGTRSRWIIGLLVLQIYVAAFLILRAGPTEGVAVLTSVTAWGFLLFRMPPARRLGVHGLLVVLVVLAVEIRPASRGRGRGEHYGPAVSSNVMALVAGWWLTRRTRRTIVADWAERNEQARDQLRMRDELRFAREVQLSMLPEAPPPLPWIDIAGASLPATEVGGDYYDYFLLGSGVALVCGDVAGHGLASGIVLTALRSGFMLLRESLTDPAAVLTRLHELVDQTSRRRMLATAAVAMIDPFSRTVRIASAGHPPVMIRSGGTVRTIELFGPPLGVRLPIEIAQSELAVSPGDVLVLHSDGVYETADAAGEMYGLDRLAALIGASTEDDATQLRDRILRDLEKFRGGAPQADDVTVVVAVMT